MWHMADVSQGDQDGRSGSDVVDSVRRISESVIGRATGLAATSTYTAIGLGLLTYQRAQARRRRFERKMRELDDESARRPNDR